jgi:hypothetical protein
VGSKHAMHHPEILTTLDFSGLKPKQFRGIE